MSEEWRPVVGYEGLYEVSSLGRVRTLLERKGIPRGHIRKLQIDKDGYAVVGIRINRKRRNLRVSRIMLEAFVRAPLPLEEACHNDGNRGNNTLPNLRWDTNKGNKADMVAHGTRMFGLNNPRTKLSDDDVAQIRLLEPFARRKDLARSFGVSQNQISLIVMGKVRVNV